MAEITKLNITDLDFDSIKNNLRDYFGSQTEFSDHDFEGSAISVMLDILAYNTYYNSYYVNMLASESFLDSAQLRDSVVSRASMLGYTPQSVTGAKANVAITVTPGDSPASITIDKDTQFTSSVNGTSYTNDKIHHSISGGYHYNSNAIYNGKSIAYRGVDPGWYLNSSYVCCYIDTTNTNTTNRWGFYKFEGGTDGIIGKGNQKPACVLAYTYSTGTGDAF